MELRSRKRVMYHGTTRAAAQSILRTGFRRSQGGILGRGVYLNRELRKARLYPISHPESDKAVIKVEVNLGKVIAIDHQGHPRQHTWHNRKYNSVFDTAFVPPNCGMARGSSDQNCVSDPKRIKILDVIYPRAAPTPPAPTPPASGC